MQTVGDVRGSAVRLRPRKPSPAERARENDLYFFRFRGVYGPP